MNLTGFTGCDGKLVLIERWDTRFIGCYLYISCLAITVLYTDNWVQNLVCWINGFTNNSLVN